MADHPTGDQTPALTLFYTAGLRGDLTGLPRLYTFLRQLKTRVSTLHPNDVQHTIDLGGACAADVWHCGISGGRSALVALDGMGYSAAVNDGYADTNVRTKLGANVNLSVIDAATPWITDGIAFVVGDSASPAPFTVRLDPAPVSRVQSGVLRLASVSAGQVGEVRVEGGRLTESAVHYLPPGTPPDPTISGIIDFILAEARYAQKKRENRPHE